MFRVKAMRGMTVYTASKHSTYADASAALDRLKREGTWGWVE